MGNTISINIWINFGLPNWAPAWTPRNERHDWICFTVSGKPFFTLSTRRGIASPSWTTTSPPCWCKSLGTTGITNQSKSQIKWNPSADCFWMGLYAIESPNKPPWFTGSNFQATKPWEQAAMTINAWFPSLATTTSPALPAKQERLAVLPFTWSLPFNNHSKTTTSWSDLQLCGASCLDRSC